MSSTARQLVMKLSCSAVIIKSNAFRKAFFATARLIVRISVMKRTANVQEMNSNAAGSSQNASLMTGFGEL
jgi:hypothetical protein